MSTTVATPIVDRNGRATTVHKNPSKGLHASHARTTGISVPSTHSAPPQSSGLVLEPTEGAPFPQANDLSKVASVVNFVDSGATTPEALAMCLESNAKSARGGSYYGDAAAYLGLIEKVSSGAADDNFSEYVLTDVGQEFLAMDATEREEVLADSVNEMDLVQVYRADGEDELKKYIELEFGYADSTVERRAACIISWSNQSEDGSLASSIDDNVADGSTRSGEAMEVVARQRREAREAAQANREKPRETCPDCFMQKSDAGTCGC